MSGITVRSKVHFARGRRSRKELRTGEQKPVRMSQIMLPLAPDIQEALRVAAGKDPITERDLRAIVAVVDWRRQRKMWRGLRLQAARGSR